MKNTIEKTRAAEELETGTEAIIRKTAGDDPLFRFLLKWRGTVLIVAAVLLGGYYMRVQYRKAYARTMSEASSLFAQVEGELRSLEQRAEKDRSGKEYEDAVARLEGKLLALEEQKFPYSEIGRAYKALFNLQQGKTSAAASELGQADLAPQKTADGKEFVSELKLLVLARGLLDDDASRTKGLAALESLVKNGRYVPVSAALTLARLARTPEEREAAVQLLTELQSRRPADADLVDEELKRLQS